MKNAPLDDRWWFDNSNGPQRNDVSESWELLRRTRFYPKLWQMVWDTLTKLDSQAYAEYGSQGPILRAVNLRRFHAKLRQIVGDRFGNLLLSGCKPTLSWVALPDEKRRLIDRYSPLLPRQRATEAQSIMTLGIGTLKRDAAGKLTLTQQHWWFPQNGTNPKGLINRFHLPIQKNSTTTFVTVSFDIRQGRDALTRQLDETLGKYLPLESVEPNWKVVSDDDASYPKMWRDCLDCPEIRPSSEPVIIPSWEYPKVRCWFLADYRIENIRQAFHALLRSQQRQEWQTDCMRVFEEEHDRFWAAHRKKKDVQDFATHVANYPRLCKAKPAKPCPTEKYKEKSASIPWIRLATHRLPIQGKLPEVKYLMDGYLKLPGFYTNKPYHERRKAALKLLRNHQQAAQSRLNDLDEQFNSLTQKVAELITQFGL